MWESLLAKLAASGGMEPGLAAALGGGTGAASPFAPATAAPTLGSGMYGLDSVSNVVNGMAPPAQGPFNAAISGGPTVLGAPAQGTGPILATEANVNKLAMAPLDPAKLMQLLGGGQQQQRAGAGSPGSPAAGRTLGDRQPVKTAPVKRPGALGG
jgi:hypothetical protein